MARPKRKKERPEEVYRRIRKPVPPPGKIEEDRRRKLQEEIDRREIDRESKPEEGE